MTHSFFSSLLIFGLLTGCTSSEPKQEQEANAPASVDIPPPESMLHATIYVTKDGLVYLNQLPIGLPDLEEALKQCRQKGCVIFYSRDNQQQDPHEAAIQVMDLVAKQELPIRFYTDSTFTEMVQF